MSVKSFLDTNIFVYAFRKNELGDKAEVAVDLISEALDTRQGITSYQVVHEFFNVALRRFEKPLSPSECSGLFEKVFLRLALVSPSSEVVLEALRLFGTHKLSWYDALIVAAALSENCSVLYSEDLQHGQRFGSMQVRNPFR